MAWLELEEPNLLEDFASLSRQEQAQKADGSDPLLPVREGPPLKCH